MNSRAVAAAILSRWMNTGNFPDRLVKSVESNHAFVMEVVYGAVKQKRLLEWVMERLARRTPAEGARPYLLVGLYQILFMSGVEHYAAVNETVTAAKGKLHSAAAGFVNAVLRRAIRERESIAQELANQPLGVALSHPDILLDRWTSRYGRQDTISLCEWNNSAARVVLRLNLARTDSRTYLSLLGDREIMAAPHAFLADRCLVLPHGVRIDRLPGYREGLFCVQDPSALVPVRMLNPQPGERVLDACAAPGGKTLHIAELMAGSGSLMAMDVHEGRLAALRENLARVGYGRPEVVHGNAAQASAVLSGREFDRILVDAPCTNTGVLRRRPDARWSFSMERLLEVRRMQGEILDGVAGLLAPGGSLVYATCSIEPEENDCLIRDWLTGHADFEVTEEKALFPPAEATDGIYAALLRRKG